MYSSEEYLKKTESAVIHLFEGINSYLKILKNSPPPIYIGESGDTLNQKPAFINWKAANQTKNQSFLQARREFLTEEFALATLCGSLLQIAAMGIQLCSNNQGIPENLPKDLSPLIKEKVEKFCIGRRVRGVPIGLVIYAGRNQYNHMNDKVNDKVNDKGLSTLNTTIFNLLALGYRYEQAIENSPKDPAFDLENERLINFSSNITTLLEWINYKSYYTDMHSLIVDNSP